MSLELWVGSQNRLAVAHEGDVALHVVLDFLLLAVHRLEDVVKLQGKRNGRRVGYALNETPFQ